MHNRTLFVRCSLGVLAALSMLACEYSFRAGTQPPPPNAPPPNGPPPAATAPAPAPTPTPTTGGLRLGRVKPNATLTPGGGTTPPPTPTGTVTPPTPSGTVTPPAAGPAVLAGANAFGTGTADPNGWTGAVYWIPTGSPKVPALASMQPNGILYAARIDTSPRVFLEGFPGIDPNRRTDFAIHYEAALVVDNEGDYDFRLASDDGAIFQIDGMTIIDNDGAHLVTEKHGPVHLVKGTHGVSIDYFQGIGPVALQLFCKKVGGADQICPLRL